MIQGFPEWKIDDSGVVKLINNGLGWATIELDGRRWVSGDDVAELDEIVELDVAEVDVLCDGYWVLLLCLELS